MSSVVVAALLLSLSAMASVRGLHHKNEAVSGKVIRVTPTSITIREGEKHGQATLTFAMDEGTPVKGGKLADLVGKEVKVVEKGPTTAKEIIGEPQQPQEKILLAASSNARPL